jgi:hypothetical protein
MTGVKVSGFGYEGRKESDFNTASNGIVGVAYPPILNLLRTLAHSHMLAISNLAIHMRTQEQEKAQVPQDWD